MEKTIQNEYGLIFWIHIIVIFFIYTSFFMFNWKFDLGFFFFYYLQLYVIGGCILTKKQFGEHDDTFYHHYLSKFGVTMSKEKISFIIDFIIIPIIIAGTLVWQMYLKKQPLLF